VSRIISVLTLLLLSFSSVADDAPVDKPFSLGAGFYRSILASDDFIDEVEFTGVAFSFGYAFTDQLAFRGTYFALEEVDFSELESKGFDLNLYLGTGLASQGVKAYVGGGLYKDKFSIGSNSESFSGLQLSGGVGYNWESISIDFILNIRETSDYEDFFNEGLPFDVDISAVSGALLLSLRF
jgi:hypothetical protein